MPEQLQGRNGRATTDALVWHRSIRLGGRLDPQKVEASHVDGRLTVRIGAVDAPAARKVEIATAPLAQLDSADERAAIDATATDGSAGDGADHVLASLQGRIAAVLDCWQRPVEHFAEGAEDRRAWLRWLAVAVITVPVLLALSWMVRSTRHGKAMRATSQDRDASAMMGINVNRTISVTFAIAGALADRFGAFRVLIAGCLFYAAGLVLMAYPRAVPGGLEVGGFLIGLSMTGFWMLWAWV